MVNVRFFYTSKISIEIPITAKYAKDIIFIFHSNKTTVKLPTFEKRRLKIMDFVVFFTVKIKSIKFEFVCFLTDAKSILKR